MDSIESAVQKRIRDTLLLDTYGALLTEKQRLACEMTWFEDLSLAETAAALGISRQGVHDQITKARENMENFDEKLSLLAHQEKLEKLAKLLEKYKPQLPEEFIQSLNGLFED